jgi:hypothetical protein
MSPWWRKMFKVPSQLRLVGERVVLRSATPEDLEGFHRVFTDPEVMRYVATGGRSRPPKLGSGLPG